MAVHNLPQYTTPFVGRLTDTVEIGNRLNDPNCRLLTLVGPGGIGKTRLALEVASRMRVHFADEVYFVPLQPLREADHIVTAIVDALPLQLSDSVDPKEQLLNYFSDKQLLVILDNFEHLLDGTGLLSEILWTAPAVKILATSREVLNLHEEWLNPVRGMDYPDYGDTDQFETYSAVQLFAECARRVRPDFSVASEQASVVRLCQLVEGMPLAIELAATWTKMLPCTQIVEEIQRNLDFLETGLQNVPERHRSMRAIFEQSWNRLTEDERGVFRKLSVFRGGFRYEAAEQVAGASLVSLSGLVDKSLLVSDPGGRYQIHELLRQYAEEKLDDSSQEHEKDRIRDAHCAYYAEFLHQRSRDMRTEREPGALRAIEAELENVRMCWDWAIERTNIEVIRKCEESLRVFYYVRDRCYEGEKAFGRAVALFQEHDQGDAGDLTLALLLMGQGVCCPRIGQATKARALLQDSVRLLRRVHVRRELAWALYELGCIVYHLSEFREAKQLHEESRILAEAVGDLPLMAWSCYNSGYATLRMGGYREALQLMQESFTRLSQAGDPDGIAMGFSALGDVLQEGGSYDQAKQFQQQSLAIHRRLDYQSKISVTLHELGRIAYAQGRYEEAQQLFQESLVLAHKLAVPRRIARGLIGLGEVSLALGESEKARKQFTESLAIVLVTGEPRDHVRSLVGLGRVAYDLGEYSEAYQYHQESLLLCRNTDSPPETIIVLNHLGQAALGLGKVAEAAQYLSEALRIGLVIQLAPVRLETLLGIAQLLTHYGEIPRAIEVLNIVVRHTASRQEIKDRAVSLMDELKAGFSSEAFPALWTRGQPLDLEAISQQLLAELESQQTIPDLSVNLALSDPLSPRELEVLALIAVGFTNREIADQLYIGISTVKKHINHIYSKLAVQDRNEAVSRAKALRLLS